MAVIQQLDPIYADFRQTAALATRLRSQQQGEQSQKSAPVTLVADGLDDKRQGRMLFSDVTVDRGTGQLALRGEFPNKDGLLLPGMYVRVTLGLGEDPAAILVPQRAVQRGADEIGARDGEGQRMPPSGVLGGQLAELGWRFVHSGNATQLCSSSSRTMKASGASLLSPSALTYCRPCTCSARCSRPSSATCCCACH